MSDVDDWKKLKRDTKSKVYKLSLLHLASGFNSNAMLSYRKVTKILVSKNFLIKNKIEI